MGRTGPASTRGPGPESVPASAPASAPASGRPGADGPPQAASATVSHQHASRIATQAFYGVAALRCARLGAGLRIGHRRRGRVGEIDVDRDLGGAEAVADE